MKTHFLATTALALSLALPGAVAAQTSGTTGATGTTGSTQPMQSRSSATRTVSIDNSIVGKDLYGANDEEVGEIEDIVMGQDGKVKSVLVDVGGFLGMGAKRVAIPVDEIEMNGERVVASNLTKERAESMQEHEGPTARITETQRTTTSVGAGTAATGTGTTATGTAAGTGVATTTRSGTSAVTAERMIDRTVIGRDLYGANDEEVGEIEDVVMGTDGKVEHVLIDVGGFLGLGAKRVAIPVDEITMQGDRIVASGLTKDQAEAMPEYKN